MESLRAAHRFVRFLATEIENPGKHQFDAAGGMNISLRTLVSQIKGREYFEAARHEVVITRRALDADITNTETLADGLVAPTKAMRPLDFNAAKHVEAICEERTDDVLAPPQKGRWDHG